MAYRLVIADWAIPPDVIALEHLVPGEETMCLVESTTLGLDVATVNWLVEQHDLVCPKLQSGRVESA